MIVFSCSQCQSKVKVKDQLAGKRIRCPHCQQVQEVPLTSQGAATRNAADSRAQASVPEDATLPPSPRSASVANDATIPPSGASSVPGPTVTYQASDHEPAGGETREVVRAGSVYEVEGEIARGGMGAIMRAVDQDIRREVAVKFLLNHADEPQKARFIEEAQITGQLEHPNIVPIHQLGVHEDGRCFFSMKMVKGRSLADILKDQGDVGHASSLSKREGRQTAYPTQFTLGRLLNIFSGICNALGYAHSRQVIHRDLKPANIMVGDFGEVYVMDWGLAKVLGRDETVAEPGPKARNKPSASKVATSRAVDSNLTQAGAIMGTPAYMPPEQALGEAGAVDERSDIYSLGAILYEILTLSPPVGRGGDQLAVLMRVLEGAITPPEKQAPERARHGLIPPELSAVALKALAKDPADRYETVEELQRDIQLFLEGRSVSAKQDSTWEMFKKLVKRNKGVSIGVGIAFLVLLGSLVFVLKAWQETGAAYAAYLKEQDAKLKEQTEKNDRTKRSAPAFLRAARLMTNEKRFGDALAQVNVALEFDPDLNEGYMLRGQLLIGLEKFAEAVQPFQEYAKRTPDDPLARTLAELAAKPALEQGAYVWALWEVFSKQKALALADKMTHLAERITKPQAELMEVYRKRIESNPGWAGRGGRLNIDKNGALNLEFSQLGQVDLSPLKGMKLSSLSLAGTTVPGLKPLEGMPLTSLNLGGTGVKDLEPLRGMKLTFLDIYGLSEIPSLEPLRGMPLTWLSIMECHKVPDLEPLRGMPLTVLVVSGNFGMKIQSLEPLRGMKLKKLILPGTHLIKKDVDPLRGMPIEQLDLSDTGVHDIDALCGMPFSELNLFGLPIRDVKVLEGMPLTSLTLGGSDIQDLVPLRNMRLTNLSLVALPVRDLGPLAKMKLTRLWIESCNQIEDFKVLKGMPLTVLSLGHCKQIRDLEFARGLPLQELTIAGCEQIHDLTPLAGMELRAISLTPRFIQKGIEIVRSMKSLDVVVVEGKGQFPVAEFWKLYDKGEFKK